MIVLAKSWTLSLDQDQAVLDPEHSSPNDRDTHAVIKGTPCGRKVVSHPSMLSKEASLFVLFSVLGTSLPYEFYFMFYSTRVLYIYWWQYGAGVGNRPHMFSSPVKTITNNDDEDNPDNLQNDDAEDDNPKNDGPENDDPHNDPYDDS